MSNLSTSKRARRDTARRTDSARTARLLFDAELSSGALADDALVAGPLPSAVRARRVPARPARLIEEVARKLGRLDHERAVSAPLVASRRAVLGDRAAAPPRFLVRVDEFPHFQAWDEPQRFSSRGYERFHAIMHGAGVPYLVAVLPRVSHAPLDPVATGARPLNERELALLGLLREDGVAFALHGRDHRTRFSSPRRRSELCGLSPAATAELLDQALADLARSADLRPDVFVAPYNRFDAAQWPVLADRFAIVGGGPESIRHVGFQRPPQWRGDVVYLPAYAPLYGRARDVLPAAERAIALQTGLWTPIVLHWGWESEAGWRELERLVSVIAPHAVRWEEFRTAVERSR